ncbi:2-amino-4-hydroxy-6-hydroxymethyldihydropteridine pyrophosphokinase [Porphyromonas crevioricanis JCM 15906]|uniref:Redox-active protein n=2 Tax=Porphyromonas crevioricanis TaxID=393921 RepID=A0AB34PE84_9PORP|nr:C-GCAxxG-C-C family (seleno)protein [Porphyromonas crevioricanis]KGN93747.1 redox-active protein [Porphyromonas crevioricanis]GAD04478.1 2-amino-4-hydroxy-6-hydroxymethyldihydropteridine pyrophosphokinase [Porphyromonas crevioricanis JCM 15906]SJZ76935.1 Putative redox-active protein (C_GCAxxG_C_C) [Porphyromonas crevioricanis]
MKTHAEDFFHNKPNNWNCCQSVLKQFQDHIALSDDEIELHYRPCGGGRAEGGLCGALYAAEELMKKHQLPSVKDDFKKEAGGTTCRELKAELKFPCVEAVRLAERLVNERLGEKSNQ